MTLSSLGFLPTWTRLPGMALALVWLSLVSTQAWAARVSVVLSNDSAPYQEVYQVVRAMLADTRHELDRRYAADLPEQPPGDAQLVMAVGVAAAEAVAALPGRTPVLAVLVPRAWYEKSGLAQDAEHGRRAVSALYLDQPFERQARLIRIAFPEANRVGAVLSEAQRGLVDEIAAALRAQKLDFVPALLEKNQRLSAALDTVLAESDLLLAVPDARVFNSATAQSIFLTSYRYRAPVLGYSRSLTRAGALLSLHSSPAQIGRQAAEWLRKLLDDPPLRLPRPAYPAYFGVSVNEQVARSLGFAVPPETELEKRLGGGR